ncbi:MAG: BPL-N domain-containing protein [Fuerstiella sp.]
MHDPSVTRAPLRRCIILFALCFAAFLCSAPTGVADADIQTGSLGTGTTWETPWRVIDSGESGPTVLVIGGVHGNEPAGYRAALQIGHWPIVRGRLVVLPRVNRLGLLANIRWAPDFRNDRAQRDLNRNFPTKERVQPQTPLCQAVWQFVTEHEPDWSFDLHEGFDFHRLNSESVGSSVIAFPEHVEFARALQQAVNADVDPERHFDLLAKSGPVNGSLARACGEQLGAKSFILETTFKYQPVSKRTRQHRRMMSTALQRIGLIDEDCTDLLNPAGTFDVTRVAIFDDNGANEVKVLKVIGDRPEIFVSHIGPEDLRPTVLTQIDVLLFPGGSGSKQGKAIGEERRRHVRQYVRDGGGVVGICAGAYLCSSHYDWSLDLMNAAVFNRTVDIPGKGRKSMWYRGPATNIDVDITKEGEAALGIQGLHSISYHNGPILSPGDDPSVPAYTPLAYFRTENGVYDLQKNSMIGTPAVVESLFGNGRVLAISPHFESTPKQTSVVLRAIEYVRRQPVTERD